MNIRLDNLSGMSKCAISIQDTSLFVEGVYAVKF